ncbi:MAG: imidazoleglycerol-phosphate dehydratase HisB [Desulfobacterales bacterium]|jgi:imidazoleglycerol-phosphate dehydratase
MKRTADIERITSETRIQASLALDGQGVAKINTGVPFFDHMLTLMTHHGFFDMTIEATGDLEVDAHHTVEDVGLVLGDAFDQALGDRAGIRRYGYAVTPMDDALASVAVDLSKRPYLVYNVADRPGSPNHFSSGLAKEFFRAFATRGGMNLHINLAYGDDRHHILEAIFKSVGRSLDEATGPDPRIRGVRSTKGRI